jgi:hypothetical protein
VGQVPSTAQDGKRDELTGALRGSFEKWLESLRDIMAA